MAHNECTAPDAKRRCGWVAAAASLACLSVSSAFAQSTATPPENTSAPSLVEPESPAVVQVTGVETLIDYATVSRLLGSTEGARRVDVIEANGHTVTFRVIVRGGSAALQRSLESSAQLVRGVDTSADRVVYEFRR